MSKFLDRRVSNILGRVDPIENDNSPFVEKCAWKRVAEREIQLEGSLQQCNSCDGYKTLCEDYYATGTGSRKLRE